MSWKIQLPVRNCVANTLDGVFSACGNSLEEERSVSIKQVWYRFECSTVGRQIRNVRNIELWRDALAGIHRDLETTHLLVDLLSRSRTDLGPQDWAHHDLGHRVSPNFSAHLVCNGFVWPCDGIRSSLEMYVGFDGVGPPLMKQAAVGGIGFETAWRRAAVVPDDRCAGADDRTPLLAGAEAELEVLVTGAIGLIEPAERAVNICGNDTAREDDRLHVARAAGVGQGFKIEALVQASVAVLVVEHNPGVIDRRRAGNGVPVRNDPNSWLIGELKHRLEPPLGQDRVVIEQDDVLAFGLLGHGVVVPGERAAGVGTEHADPVVLRCKVVGGRIGRAVVVNEYLGVDAFRKGVEQRIETGPCQ